MVTRKRADLGEAEVPENPKRDLLVAFAPDSLADTLDFLWDSVSVLARFSPEELQRLQVGILLLILDRLQQLGVQDAPQAKSGGFDGTYFRELIASELGEEPDDQTLQVLAALAGDPSRLERAVLSCKRYLENHPVDKPLGLLVSKLRAWREEDGNRRRRKSF